MADVRLDGQRLRGHLAERLLEPGLTLRRLLQVVRADLLTGGRYLAGIQVDGRALSGQTLAVKLGGRLTSQGRVDLTSAKLGDVLLRPLEHCERQIAVSLEDVKATLSLLAEGQEAKAYEHLASQVGVWPLMVEHQQRLLAAMHALGWPSEDLRGLEVLPQTFTGQVMQLREMLATRDTPGAVVLLSGAVLYTHRKALRALHYLKRRVQRPRRRTHRLV